MTMCIKFTYITACRNITKSHYANYMLNTLIKSYAFALYFISILQWQVFFHFFSIFVHYRFPLKFIPSVLWHCWVGDRKGILPVKCFIPIPAILKCSLGDILELVVIVGSCPPKLGAAIARGRHPVFPPAAFNVNWMQLLPQRLSWVSDFLGWPLAPSCQAIHHYISNLSLWKNLAVTYIHG